MVEKKARKMIDHLNDFFSDKSKYIPRVCFSETNQDIGDDSYFVITLSKGLSSQIPDMMSKLGYEVPSFQMERVEDEYLSYIVLKHPDGQSDMGIIERALKDDGKISDFRIKRISSLEKNPFTYPIKVYSNISRSLCLDIGLFHAMFRIIPNSLGSGGDYLMYMSGVSVSNYIWNSFDLKDQEDFEEQFQLLEDVLRTIGFGMVTFENIDPLRSEGRIIIKNSLEEGLSESCPFMRGMLTDLIRKIFEDINIDIVETSCINKGDAECIFELTRVKEI
ncbi:MAG: hypothetical protein JW825_03430 [Candidatus Methanofastidiosa archaeon]|nr:hypothetical protein [Candidatus Methanofastidiosa archaeon]